MPQFCDVALPLPLDMVFTYRVAAETHLQPSQQTLTQQDGTLSGASEATGPVVGGVISSLAASRARTTGRDDALPITERDIPFNIVLLVSALCLIPLAVLLGAFLSGSVIASSAIPLVIGALVYVVLAGIIVAAVCGYMAGLIGSSNSPVSGLAILTVLGAALLLLGVARPGDPNAAKALVAYALFATAIVFGIATISNDNLQDLKTGQLVGATPWRQQVSLVIGVLVGVPAGVYAAIHRNRFADYAVRISSLLGLSFPPFVSAIILLLVFAIALPWFPVISARSGSVMAWYQSITLPAISLGLISAAYVTRVTRSAMLEVLSEDYVRTARAKGVPWNVVIWRHALRNALIPIITVVGLYLGILIGNSVLTEIVFSRPGLGKLLIGALNQRDYPMLQGMMVIYTLIVVLVNLLTDLAYGFVDPRVKLQ